MKNKIKNWEKIHNESLKWAKWMALYEAINIISDKAQEKGIPFQNVEIKPLAVHKYMEMTENIFLRKILKNDHGIDICFDEMDTSELNKTFLEPNFQEEAQEYQYSP